MRFLVHPAPRTAECTYCAECLTWCAECHQYCKTCLQHSTSYGEDIWTDDDYVD